MVNAYTVRMNESLNILEFQIGKERIKKIYELADIYHSDNIERVSDDFIADSGLQNGNFDNIS